MFELFKISERFMPHGHCYLWQADILWMNVVSDGLISLAYFAIPCLLVRLLRNNPKISQKWVIAMFGLFITFCGITHLISIVTIWRPIYYVEGLIKAITASLSVVTAILFAPILHDFLRAKSATEHHDTEE